MNKIYMSADLYNDLRKKQKSIRQHGRDANLFMGGANKNGILVEALNLRNTGEYGDSCTYMPEIDGSILAKAYLRIIKKRYTPSGFIHLIHDTEHNEIDWDGDYGIAPRVHRNIPFITMSSEFIQCYMVNTKGDRLYPELALVDKNFKPNSALKK